MQQRKWLFSSEWVDGWVGVVGCAYKKHALTHAIKCFLWCPQCHSSHASWLSTTSIRIILLECRWTLLCGAADVHVAVVHVAHCTWSATRARQQTKFIHSCFLDVQRHTIVYTDSVCIYTTQSWSSSRCHRHTYHPSRVAMCDPSIYPSIQPSYRTLHTTHHTLAAQMNTYVSAAHVTRVGVYVCSWRSTILLRFQTQSITFVHVLACYTAVWPCMRMPCECVCVPTDANSHGCDAKTGIFK